MIKRMSTPVLNPEAKNLNERAAHLSYCENHCSLFCKDDPARAYESYSVHYIIP